MNKSKRYKPTFNIFECSYIILSKVIREKAYLNIAFNEVLSQKHLDNQEKSRITALTYGVLEHYYEMDFILGKLTQKKPKNSIRVLLFIGIYALKYMHSLRDYYVVNSIVELAKQLGKQQSAGFINAILNNVQKVELPPENAPNYCSVHYNYPDWLANRIIMQYGDSAHAIMAYRSQTTNFRVGVLPLLLNDVQRNVLSDAFISNYNDLEKQLANGWVTAQSLASMLVCRVLFEALAYEKTSDISLLNQYREHYFSTMQFIENTTETTFAIPRCLRDVSIGDFCAAPGGKSVYLATLFPNAKITSADIHPHRLDLIRAYAERMHINNLNIILQDATDNLQSYDSSFDACLVDAPCSGIGVAYSKPDILIHKSEQDLIELPNTQRKILNNVAKCVKPGGYLIYSTCTILAEENQNIVDDFLAKNQNFISEKIELPDELAMPIGNYVQILPHMHHTSGFFIAKLKRLNG